MQNLHYNEAEAIIAQENADATQLLIAQVHATLAVAQLVNTLTSVIEERRKI